MSGREFSRSDTIGFAMVAVHALQRLSGAVNAASRIVLVPIILFFVGVVFVAVLSRYVLDEPIIESIELTRLGFNWGCFLAAAIGVKEASHVRFVFLFDRLPETPRRAVALGLNILMAVFFVMMIWEGWKLFAKIKDTVFPALDWSQGLLYIPLPLAGAIMLIHALAAIATDAAVLCGKESGR